MEEDQIEKLEYQFLDFITQTFESEYENLQKEIDRTDLFKSYLLPTVFASSSVSTFNIYDEILEKHAGSIIRENIPSEFQPRPLSVSSDICFESENCILHIDIKTANTSNSSDYENCVPVGTNQTTYSGEIDKFKRSYDSVPGFKVYPSLPTEYTVKSQDKLTVTLAVQIIYESYTDEVDNIIEEWNKAHSSVKNTLLESVKKFYKPSVADIIYEYLNRNSRIDTISNNILLRELVDPFENFYVVEENFRIIQRLREVIEEASVSCTMDTVKCIVIPNGQLSPLYDSSMKSGKKWGDSIRYYHTNGNENFKLLSEEAERVRYIN